MSALHLLVVLLVISFTLGDEPQLLQTIEAPKGVQFFGLKLSNTGDHMIVVAGDLDNGALALFYHYQDAVWQGPNTILEITPFGGASGSAQVSARGDLALIGTTVALFDPEKRVWFRNAILPPGHTLSFSAIGQNAIFFTVTDGFVVYTTMNGQWSLAATVKTPQIPWRIAWSKGPGATGALLFIAYYTERQTGVMIYDVTSVSPTGPNPTYLTTLVIPGNYSYLSIYSISAETYNWARRPRLVVSVGTGGSGVVFLWEGSLKWPATSWEFIDQINPPSSSSGYGYDVLYRTNVCCDGGGTIVVSANGMIYFYSWKQDSKPTELYTLSNPDARLGSSIQFVGYGQGFWTGVSYSGDSRNGQALIYQLPNPSRITNDLDEVIEYEWE